MKNQYFGDINDYRKYGLIRSILRCYEFRLLVAWMLTPNDEGSDGGFTGYLCEPDLRDYDRELYDELQRCLISQKNIRRVALIEKTNLLPGARYYSRIVPDSYDDRIKWSQELLSEARGSDLVFLDPDNGLEVKSKPLGRKGSSKYLYRHEISGLWEQGKSLLIYQHFCREKRHLFIERIRGELEKVTKDCVAAFVTRNVVFFLALQPEHRKYLDYIVADVESKWGDQITYKRKDVSEKGTEGRPSIIQ